MTTQTEALKLALDLATMHHTDDGYAELRSKVRQLAKEALAQPAVPQGHEQEPVAFPRQAGKSTWTVDAAFIWRVKHTIDPDTPNDFTPSEEQIETVLLALEKIPSNLYTTPPQRKPLTYVDLRRIANQCGLGANEISAQAQAKVDNFARAIEQAHGIKE